jgi:hypothetical protein
MSRKDQLLRILAALDGHFAADDVSPADVDRRREQSAEAYPVGPRSGQKGLNMHYDADKAPDPGEWLELDEWGRIDSSTIIAAQSCRLVIKSGSAPRFMSSLKIRLPWATRRWCRRRSIA